MTNARRGVLCEDNAVLAHEMIYVVLFIHPGGGGGEGDKTLRISLGT